MFSFFKRSVPKIYPAFDFIGVDMHNHLLPGIDDGSPDVETSISLKDGLHELGFRHFVCTPHVISEVHPNTPETIGNAASKLNEQLKSGSTPQVKFAAEYMVNYDFDTLMQDSENLLSFGKNRQVLIEMSYAVESPNLREAIFYLNTKGYRPILAHPERYPYLYKNGIKEFETIFDAGADLQLNLLSLEGYYGKMTQKIAEELLANQLISWVGTDLHHERHLQALINLANNKKALAKLQSIKRLENPKLSSFFEA